MDDAADPAAFHDLAERAARAGGEVALSTFRRDLRVDTKSDAMDVVTEADLAAQERAVAVLRETDPDGTIVAEEAGVDATIPQSGRAWVVDPIDGTNNFAVGNRLWASCVACVVDSEPRAAVTYVPAMDDIYVADGQTTRRNDEPVSVRSGTDPTSAVAAPAFSLSRRDRPAYTATTEALVATFGDIRRLGSGQTALAMVAAGELDGVVTTLQLSPWDTVAGAHLVRRAGGRVTDVHGDSWSHDSPGLVASNGGVHDDLLAAAREGLAAGD